MYRIVSEDQDIPFYYSSYDTASVYLRSQRYNSKPGEKCVSSCDILLILHLQMNVLTHVIMEDTSIYNEIHQILNIPDNILNEDEDKRKQFLTDLRREGETVHYRGRSHDSVDHVTWLWRYWVYNRPDIVRSCIGLYPHNDIYIIDNKPYRKPSKKKGVQLNNQPGVRCLLYSLLLTEKYQLNLNEQSHRIIRDKIRDRYFTDVTDDDLVDFPEGFTETRDGVITFISDDIRHDIMYAFVTECLLEDSDLEFFLTTASRDVISEYCRSWWYKRSEGERCLYVPMEPEEIHDLFIDNLQLDIITHCTVSDKLIHDRISKRLNIPEEVLKWDLEERKRFVDKMNKDTVHMYRARCLLVGCTGAGKTTVLRNLKRKKGGEATDQPTESTIGLDVHQDLFLIGESEDDSGSTLIDYESHTAPLAENYEKRLLSVMDFAGQAAYYACHQVYLSRRAIYLLVVDKTQDLNTKLKQDDRNCVQGTLFEEWTALEYFTFWLQTIRTYGKEDGYKGYKRIPQITGSSEHGKTLTPIIVLETHRDSYKDSKACDEDTSTYGSFFIKLHKHIPENIKNLVCEHFELELPPRERSHDELRELEKLRRYIAKTLESLPHWGERVPKQWSDFEQIIRERQGSKISSKDQLQKFSEHLTQDEFSDILKFYHEIGMILYFPDLGDDIILDIQWFVDAFKYIITDRKHVPIKMATHEDWDQYFDVGMITESLMLKIWKEIGNNSTYARYLNRITPFMEKLGILAQIGKKDTRENQCYYIPSMNKRQLMKGEQWTRWKKTPILSFYFKTYLPHFFFFRLVVACFALFDTQAKELYKNIALFCGAEKDEYHTVAIAVNKTSIQLQVLTPPGNGIPLRTERTRAIRLKIEKKISELTKTFHGNVDYEIGFPCSCKPIFITKEDERQFISEKELLKISADFPPCPRCKVHSDKRINKKQLLEIWGEAEL
ncbi:uncharacterized protein LOC134282373 [Saccostrea cucullata]|uniref:uncharacterized protein LOC134282373 n=1 Tax=Saccostrea cuccullata TaxID=36930 RepID=UPI002ED355F8